MNKSLELLKILEEEDEEQISKEKEDIINSLADKYKIEYDYLIDKMIDRPGATEDINSMSKADLEDWVKDISQEMGPE